MQKAQLRKVYSDKRKRISKQELEALSTALLKNFKQLDFSEIKTLHIFLPIETKNEPNTFLFIDWLCANHPNIKIIVPRTDFQTSLMTNHTYKGTDGLKKNIFDILEPQKEEIHTGDIDLVVIPLLCFDKSGFRVGYGKGFYDRFLQGIKTQKVGLSLFDEVVEIDDVDEFDVAMDICITPGRIVAFQ